MSHYIVLPGLIRVLLTIIEPIFALNGACLVMTHPDRYLDMMIRSSAPADPTSTTGQHNLAYTQLAGAWVMFALLGATVLRATRDRRVWKHTCLAMLASDAFHVWSMVQGAGSWGDCLNVRDWTSGEWKVAVGSYPFLFARLFVVYRSFAGRGNA